MKTKLIVCGALLTAVMGSAVLAAPPGGGPGMGGPGGPGAGPAGRGAARGPQAPAGLGAAMRDMGSMLATLKKDAPDPTKIDDVLKTLATFERDVAIAKLQNPPTNNVDAASKDKAPADFRAAMTKLQHILLDLEDSVVAKKVDDINKHIAELEQIEKDGHAEFKVGARISVGNTESSNR